MTIDRAVSDMHEEELRQILIRIHNILWSPDEYYDDVEWSADTLQEIADVFESESLHPMDLEEYQDGQ